MPTKQKEGGNRCVLTLPLLTEPWQEHIIEKSFKIIEHLKNQDVRKGLSAEHKAICEALEARNVEEARTILCSHIENQQKSIIRMLKEK